VGGTTITGGGGGGTNGGGGTGGTESTGGVVGVTLTGGLIGHIGGKNAEAAGDHTANGTAESVTVTAGSNFLSFFRKLRRAMTRSFPRAAGCPVRAGCEDFFGSPVRAA
jgi:hypothetical protein